MLDGFFFRRHLEEDEVVRLIVHKHWFLGLRVLVWPTLSFIVAQILLSMMTASTGVLLCALWSISSLVWWLRNFLDYYLDAWVITDRAVIDLEWLGWFHRHSQRMLYSDIQGVSTEIHGIAGTLLRFGTVTIEKISTGATVSLPNVPRPRAVESVILRNMEEYLHGKNLKNAKHVEELLSQFVAQHMQEEEVRTPEAGKPAEPKGPRRRKGIFSSMRIGSPHP